VASSSKKIPLTDYAALAADVRARQEQDDLELKQIAAQSGVEKSKLSNLVNRKGGLSTDNLLLICDWLGKSLDDYRLGEVPAWVLERLASANSISTEEAERMVDERTKTARRQAVMARAARERDPAAVLAAVAAEQDDGES
jgi:transcriptional regulator with XRE-family HTH domain